MGKTERNKREKRLTFVVWKMILIHQEGSSDPETRWSDLVCVCDSRVVVVGSSFK
jgi:hypothetical protein